MFVYLTWQSVDFRDTVVWWLGENCLQQQVQQSLQALFHPYQVWVRTSKKLYQAAKDFILTTLEHKASLAW